MSQSTTNSVRDFLPVDCLLNLEDEDFSALNSITEVNDLFHVHSEINNVDNDNVESDNDNHIDVDLDQELMRDLRDYDKIDIAETEQFFDQGCGCKLLNGEHTFSIKLLLKVSVTINNVL